MTKVFEVNKNLDHRYIQIAQRIVAAVNDSIARGIPLVFYFKSDGAHDLISYVKPGHTPRLTRTAEHYDTCEGFYFSEYIGAYEFEPPVTTPRDQMEMFLAHEIPFVLVYQDVEYDTPEKIRAVLDSWDGPAG